jgi:hypothetical protein
LIIDTSILQNRCLIYFGCSTQFHTLADETCKFLSQRVFELYSTSSAVVINLLVHSNVKYGHDIFKWCETLIPVRIVFIKENNLNQTIIHA